MADDQSSKNNSIDDLVRELSKSSTTPITPTPPLAPDSQAPRPSFPTTKPPVAVSPPPIMAPSPKPLEMSRPQSNVSAPPLGQMSQPKPVSPPINGPAPSTATPLPTPGVKEYQSSIRTMNEDISKLKQGQQPMGVNIPRKVEVITPAPAVPVAPTPVPGPQFKAPVVNLGEAKKTGPLAQSKDFSRPRPSTPPPVSTNSMSAKPIPAKTIADPKPQINIPEARQKGGNHNTLFMGVGAVVLVAGFSYWFFVLRSPAPEVVIETPTPTATETPAPTPTPTLNYIFSGAQSQNVIIKATNSLTSFVSDISKILVEPGVFKAIEATDIQTPPVAYSFADLIIKLGLKIPSELVTNFGNDSAVFVYGQKESFDSKGNLQVGVTAPNRVVIIAELKTPADASQAATNWETTLSADFKVLFGLGTANKTQPAFLDNSYRNTSIRYRNFPYADKTIDYAIVSASNSKMYLVVTDSKEAIFATIDKLKGF